jgi:hypothetical protein
VVVTGMADLSLSIRYSLSNCQFSVIYFNLSSSCCSFLFSDKQFQNLLSLFKLSKKHKIEQQKIS